MTETAIDTSHFCPKCGTAQKHFPRYPWYFCKDCVKTASDRNGRKLLFGNVSMSGGLSWRYADDPSQRDDSSLGVICNINQRPVYIHEARFGGIVAEPIPDNGRWWQSDNDTIVDLWSQGRIKAAQARLKPI